MLYSNIQRKNELLKGIISGDYKWNDNNLDVTFDSILYTSSTGIVQKRDTQDIIDSAIEYKRQGLYDKSIELYLDVIECTLQIGGGLSVMIIRSLSKVLIASNDYVTAFTLLNECYKHYKRWQGSFDYHGNSELENVRATLIIFSRCTENINEESISMLYMLSQSFSGNPRYEFVQSHEQIKKQLEIIAAMTNCVED